MRDVNTSSGVCVADGPRGRRDTKSHNASARHRFGDMV